MSLPDRIAAWEVAATPEAETMEEDVFASVTASPHGALIARLVPTHGGEAIELCERTDRITLGRSRELPVEHRVDGDRVSARHCDLLVDPLTHQLTLRDASTNGTHINGARMEKHATVSLDSGDCVALAGEATASFVLQYVRLPTNTATLAEELTCSVCHGLYIRPCSVLPCLHVFCAACVSRWLRDGHRRCMECRGELREVRPACKIQSCVDRLVAARPSLAREAAELAEHAANDDIPPNGWRHPKRGRSPAEDEHSEGHSSHSSHSDEDEEDEEEVDVRAALHYGRHAFAQRGASGRCRHCAAVSPVDGFRCPPGAPHLICADCQSHFPQRPLCPRAQRCQLCSAPHCALYYADEGGCAAGVGGMTRMSEGAAPSALPRRTFGGNAVEQNILMNYLSAQRMELAEVWRECIERFRAGDWVPDVACVNGGLTADAVLCAGCTEDVFAALLFHYRRAVPSARLPEEVTRRSNCWYGMNCRTQFHKPHHANNLNHVCYEEKRKE